MTENQRSGWFLHTIPWRARIAGEIIPRGYRVAYVDFCRQEDIYCPFGLHWLVRFFHRCWERSFAYRESALERMMDDVRRHERNKEGLFVTGTPCNDCGGNLIYSARELGTGLCHRCAHHRYAELLDTLKIAQEPVDTNDLR